MQEGQALQNLPTPRFQNFRINFFEPSQISAELNTESSYLPITYVYVLYLKTYVFNVPLSMSSVTKTIFFFLVVMLSQ